MDDTIEVGGYTALLLRDGVFSTSSEAVLHEDGEAATKLLRETRLAEGLRIDVNCVLLRGAGRVVLVDAGCGAAMGPGLGRARTLLADAGVRPEQVDTVLVTHVHGDHVLGLLEGDAAWLPRARLVVPALDLADAEPGASGRRGLASRLGAAYEGRIDLVHDGDEPIPGVTALAAPGHTPGHVAYLVAGATELLLWGDVLHLAAIQPGDPGVVMAFDEDRAQASRTRTALLARAAESGWTVGGGHLPGFMTVHRAGAHFRMES